MEWLPQNKIKTKLVNSLQKSYMRLTEPILGPVEEDPQTDGCWLELFTRLKYKPLSLNHSFQEIKSMLPIHTIDEFLSQHW